MSKPRGVIFDLWNTLVESGGPRLVERIARIINQDDELETTPSYGLVDAADVTEYMRASGCLHIETPVSIVLIDLWRRARREDIPQWALDAFQREEQEFVDRARFKENALEVIEQLRALNLKVSIVSNASAASIEVLRRLDLRDRVTSDIWLSCQSGFLKPEPRAFTTVANQWRLPPVDVLIVGDKIATDMLGARLCGMRAILLNDELSAPVLNTRTTIQSLARNLRDVAHMIEELVA
jgi:putative hydrolase of the HAD superfamily